MYPTREQSFVGSSWSLAPTEFRPSCRSRELAPYYSGLLRGAFRSGSRTPGSAYCCPICSFARIANISEQIGRTIARREERTRRARRVQSSTRATFVLLTPLHCNRSFPLFPPAIERRTCDNRARKIDPDGAMSKEARGRARRNVIKRWLVCLKSRARVRLTALSSLVFAFSHPTTRESPGIARGTSGESRELITTTNRESARTDNQDGRFVTSCSFTPVIAGPFNSCTPGVFRLARARKECPWRNALM